MDSHFAFHHKNMPDIFILILQSLNNNTGNPIDKQP